jgi:hypothetical protein
VVDSWLEEFARVPSHCAFPARHSNDGEATVALPLPGSSSPRRRRVFVRLSLSLSVCLCACAETLADACRAEECDVRRVLAGSDVPWEPSTLRVDPATLLGSPDVEAIGQGLSSALEKEGDKASSVYRPPHRKVGGSLPLCAVHTLTAAAGYAGRVACCWVVRRGDARARRGGANTRAAREGWYRVAG